MRKIISFVVYALIATETFGGIRQHKQPLPKYKDATVPIEERVEDLLSRMTLKEKIGQLMCPLGWHMYDKTVVKTNKGTKSHIVLSDEYKNVMADIPPGSLWGIQRADPWTRKTLETGIDATESAQTMNLLQKYAIEQTRLGIPVMIMEEAPHGHMGIGSTCFPTGIGQASTFNVELMQQMGTVIGRELSLRGAHIAYGPILDISREPRWSRVEETLGEDAYLAGMIGGAICKGVRAQGVINTLKHFAAYGIPESGLNGEQVSLGWNQLLNEYIPQFQQAINDGAGSIMTSYNVIDGIPCTGNKDGDEVAQLYLCDEYSSVAIPRKLLKGFQRVSLKAGETCKLSFKLGMEEMSIYNADRRKVVEPGTFRVFVKGSSATDKDTPTCEFEIK